jgi:hypothetical protein
MTVGFAAFVPTPPEGSFWICGAAIWLIVVLPVCFSGLALMGARWMGLGRIRAELLPTVGLAIFVFAGGILNVMRLAFPCSIWFLLAVGFLAWAGSAWRRTRTFPSGMDLLGALKLKPDFMLLALVGIGILALTASSQLAPRVFNWHDDLQKYFAHPVRMLETGTLYGSPLSAIGAETLGGLAFIHASILLWLPIEAMNGADAVLGQLLCLVPLFAFGVRHKTSRAIAAVAMLSVVIIDPFYVNVSALFLGSALIMGAVMLTSDEASIEGSPVALGMIYACLVTLKPTFLLFAAPHFALIACSRFLGPDGMRGAVKWAMRTAGWSACFVSPWVVLHLPHYMARATLHVPGKLGLLHDRIQLLSLAPMAAGLTGLRAYTVLVLAIGVLAAVCLGAALRQRTGSVRLLGVAAAAVATVAAYPFMLFVFPRILGYADADPNAVRYFIPLAIAVFPIALCVAPEALEKAGLGLSPGALAGLCLSLGLASLVLFSGTAAERFRTASNFGTFMPFRVAYQPELAAEMKYALSRAKLRDVREQQQMLPAGASLIAWTNAPYFLDYSRNTIFDVEVAGISNPWAVPPQSDYILWEYRGSADPQARTRHLVATLSAMERWRAAPIIDFDRVMWDRVKAGTVVFKNDEYLLVRTAVTKPGRP